MSRKDYILIAQAFADHAKYGDSRADNNADYLRYLREIADTLADCMANDNPNFRRSQFMSACGFSE